MRVTTTAFCALAVALVSRSAALAGPGGVGTGVPAFAEHPGELEFSGRLIVRPLQLSALVGRGLDAKRAAAAHARAVERLQPMLIERFAQVDEYLVAVPPGQSENGLASQLMATGDYQYVEPDWVCYPSVVPNDPNYPNQWHHTRLESPLAWDLTEGSEAITCAFVDTGIYLTHEDLQARLVSGYNSADDVAQADGGDVSDINGHGTAVAGTAAAIGNNGVGVAGMGWNLRIMPIRTTNSCNGSASISDILRGARWAVDHGAKVVSASYSGVSSSAVGTTGTYVKAAGGLFCFAAGNSNSNLAAFDWADTIVVGATDQADNKAGFSSYGRAVDLYAPGVNVWTTYNGGGYGGASGTSFSTPMVNGVIGMIWSANPDLTPTQVEFVLFYACEDFGPPGDDEYWGWGRANLFRSVRDAIAAGGPVAPIGINDEATIFLNNGRWFDVLANDFDINGDELTIGAFDAASALGGAVERSPGSGPGGRDELFYTPPSNVAGTDTFTYTVRDPGGLTDLVTVTVLILDPATFRVPENPASTAPGVEVAYYALPELSALPDFSLLTPIDSEVVTRVNAPSTEGEFMGSGRADDVGAVFTGYITVPAFDVYTFFTESDDGSNLYIGDQLVVNNDGLHGMVEAAGQIALQAGTHAARVEFFEHLGGAGVIARIRGGGLNRQVIPSSRWSRDVCPADFNGDGTADVQDVLAYLGAFSTADPRADITGDGVVNVQDFLAFLGAYAAGC